MGICYSDTEKRIKFQKYPKYKISIKNDEIYNNKFKTNGNRFTGFYNIGNSCYMNSFLQILLHIPNFLEYLKKDYKNSNKESILIQNIINLANFPNNKNYLYLIQEYMSNISSNYNRYKQADSQNFGIDLINEIITNIKGEEELYSEYNNNINEEMNNIINYKKIKYNEFIKKYQKENELIFLEHMFLVNEILNVKDKNRNKYSFFSSLDVELVFPNLNQEIYKLEDLFNFKYNNSSFKKICRIPKVLIISISRSFINNKLNTSCLIFPDEFNISSYVDKDLIKKNESLKYKLFAINEKEGISKKDGHFHCSIKLKNQFYTFDDRNVFSLKDNLNDYYHSNKVVGLFYIMQK